jgi:hypothetical protein
MNIRFPSSAALLLGVLLMLATLPGCTTVDQKITLRYAPINSSFGQHSGEIIVARVESAPLVKNSKGEWILGSINNVHGVHQADLLTDRNLGEWITDALLLELKHAGYTATQKPSIPDDAARGIRISDIKAFVNVNKDLVKVDIKQELKFNVNLYLNGVRAKTFAVASRNNQTLAWSASVEENENIMFHSLQDAMKQIIPEIIALTNKK